MSRRLGQTQTGFPVTENLAIPSPEKTPYEDLGKSHVPVGRLNGLAIVALDCGYAITTVSGFPRRTGKDKPISRSLEISANFHSVELKSAKQPG
jgi:hypothetical protein